MRLVIKSILLKSKMEDLKMKTLGELFVALNDNECNALAEMRKLIKEKNFTCEDFKNALEIEENITSAEHYDFLSKLRIIVRALKDGNAFIRSAKVYADGHIHYRITDKFVRNEMEIVVNGTICYIRDEHDFCDIDEETIECFREQVKRQECIYYEHTKE